MSVLLGCWAGQPPHGARRDRRRSGRRRGGAATGSSLLRERDSGPYVPS